MEGISLPWQENVSRNNRKISLPLVIGLTMKFHRKKNGGEIPFRTGRLVSSPSSPASPLPAHCHTKPSCVAEVRSHCPQGPAAPATQGTPSPITSNLQGISEQS